MKKTEPTADKDAPKPAPVEFAGQWIAWSKDRTEVVAHGPQLAMVHAEAVALGHPDAILQRVRHPDLSFIGVA